MFAVLMPVMFAASSAAGSDAGATSGSLLTSFTDWVVNIMDTLGLGAVLFLTTLENILPFVPSEIVLPLAGFTASRGTGFGVIAAVVTATIGAVCGSLVLYGLAYKFGRERTRRWMAKVPLLDIEDINKTEAFFDKHSKPTVFFGRMLPVFRCLISLPAGVVKMHLWQFILYTAAGSLIWNVILVSAGYVLGENWHIVEQYGSLFSKIFIALVLIVCVVWIVRRVQRNRRS
ncbi:MAG: DedA family protein [Actinomycetaceae bacterium]|nr:DedA family protein [Actinomycetaceae bacterium]MDY5854707.1 DedA family protein [Arcanobacterium sp.]